MSFRRACLTRVGLLDDEAHGIEDWDLWIRIAELYPVLAAKEVVAIWRRPNPSSQQFTSRGERLHAHARRLHDREMAAPAALSRGFKRAETQRPAPLRPTPRSNWSGKRPLV